MVLAACGAGQPASTGDGKATPHAEQHTAALPGAHVHAVERDPAGGRLLLATHEGLFVYGEGVAKRVGPVLDLMGFTVAGPGHYYASGHPGAGTHLPEPVGLIESRDGGKSWQVLSRGGESDFHALTTTASGVVGFDGTLRSSSDGHDWQTAQLAAPPRALAGSGDHETVLATTEQGLMRSTDAGHTWKQVAKAPLLYLVDWADRDTVVGLTPQGVVHVSDDRGATWRATELVAEGAEALGASGSGTDVQVHAVADGQLLVSRGESSFEALPVES